MKKTTRISMLAGVVCLLVIYAGNVITEDVEARPNEATTKAEKAIIENTDTVISTAKRVETTAHDWAVESVSLLSLGAVLLFVGGALRGRLKKRSEASVLRGHSLECESRSCA